MAATAPFDRRARRGRHAFGPSTAGSWDRAADQPTADQLKQRPDIHESAARMLRSMRVE
jgi:hypothetical protein